MRSLFRGKQLGRVKCHQAAAELAQAEIAQRRHDVLPFLPIRALEFREQGFVGMAEKATEYLLFDQRRRGCRILGKPRSQSLCDARAEFRRIGDGLGTAQLQICGCSERQERWRLVDRQGTDDLRRGVHGREKCRIIGGQEIGRISRFQVEERR